MKIAYMLARDINAIFHPYYRMQWLSMMGIYDHLSDEEWVKKAYKRY